MCFSKTTVQRSFCFQVCFKMLMCRVLIILPAKFETSQVCGSSKGSCTPRQVNLQGREGDVRADRPRQRPQLRGTVLCCLSKESRAGLVAVTKLSFNGLNQEVLCDEDMK